MQFCRLSCTSLGRTRMAACASACRRARPGCQPGAGGRAGPPLTLVPAFTTKLPRSEAPKVAAAVLAGRQDDCRRLAARQRGDARDGLASWRMTPKIGIDFASDHAPDQKLQRTQRDGTAHYKACCAGGSFATAASSWLRAPGRSLNRISSGPATKMEE